MYVVQDILEQTFQKTKVPQSLYVNPLHAGEHSGHNYQQYYTNSEMKINLLLYSILVIFYMNFKMAIIQN